MTQTAYLLVGLLVGLLLGGALAYLWAKLQQGRANSEAEGRLRLAEGQTKQLEENASALKAELEQARHKAEGAIRSQAQAESLQQTVAELKAGRQEAVEEIRKANDAIVGLKSELSEAKADNNALQKNLATQQAELEKMHARLKTEFENLAGRILEEKSQKFADQNRVNLDALLKPLGEQMRAFKTKVENTHVDAEKRQASLMEKIQHLQEASARVSEEANTLASALKGEKTKKVQGDWGEMILENILEQSGLRKGEEYLTQNSYKNDEGKNRRPDVVIKYPGGRNVVVDSKVSLAAYERFYQTEDESELDGHVAAIRSHVDDLAGKRYDTLAGLNTPDFVMLFVPIEPAFLLAIQRDPSLWRYAYERGVVLISPTNLIAVLKMVESLWQQERQSKNAEQIAKVGGQLLDRFRHVARNLSELGVHLRSASDKFDETAKRLSDGGRTSVIKKIQELEALGAKTDKALEEKDIKGLPEEVQDAIRDRD